MTTSSIERRRARRAVALSAAVAGCAVALFPGHRALAADPSNNEQYLLELVNRMRMNPAGELHKLVNISGNPAVFGSPISNDPDVASAVAYFGVDPNILQQQWNTLVPAAPLAWNTNLSDAATGHNNLMIADNTQSHQLPGEPDLVGRATNAGYVNWSNLGENVYAYARSMFYGHAGLAIDWGNAPGTNTVGGMQNPPGHRQNIMSGSYREIGIAVGTGPGNGDGTDVGPYVITQDFGARFSGGPWLVGALYNDTVTADDFYTPGEGLGGVGVQVFIAGTSTLIAATNTTSSGGYVLQVPANSSYDVKFTGGPLAAPVTYANVGFGTSNVKVDTLSSWAPDSNGSWTSTANWSAGVPNGTGTIAVLGTNTSTNRTISVNTPVTVGTLKFDGPYGYTVGGAGTVTLDVASGAALINVAVPVGQTVSAGVQLNHNTSIVVASGGSLTLSGSFGISASNTATFSGPGVLNIAGPQAHGASSGLTVSGGTVNVNTNPGSSVSRTLSVNVNAGGSVNFNASQDLAQLTVAGRAAMSAGTTMNVANGVTVTNGATFALSSGAPRLTHAFGSLAIGSTSTLDVGGQNVQLNRGALAASDPNSVLQQAYAKIVSAYHSPNPGIALGDWKGPGITSALAKADIALPATSRAGLAIGIWDSTDAQIQTGQPANTVRIAPTVLGDANGDLFTDNADFAIWRNNFGNGDHWSQGDFNYDQFTDNADFAIWRNNFGNFPSFGSAANSVSRTASSSATTSGPTTLSGSTSHSATPTAASAKPALAPFPATAQPAVGTVAVNVDPGTGDVLLDINLQNQSDLESVQFKAGTANAMITANYNGMVGQGFSGWAFSGAPTTRLIAEFNQLAQTAFPNEVVLDFGNFWDTVTNAQNIQFTYNTTPHGGGFAVTNVGVVTYIPVPEPASLSLIGLATAGLMGRRRRRRAPARGD